MSVEINTNSINNSSNNQSVSVNMPSAPLIIHTMPERYLPGNVYNHSADKLKSKFNWLRWLIVGVLFIGLTGGITYAFLKFYIAPQKKAQLAENSMINQTSTSDVVAPVSENVGNNSAEQNLQGQISNLGSPVTIFNLYLQEGAVSSTETESVFKVFGQLVEGGTDPNFEIIGGTYNVTPENLTLLKKATLTITYQQDAVLNTAETYLRLGYFSGGSWHSFENSQVDTNQNIVSVSFDVWPSNIFTLLIPKDVMATLKPATQLLSQDSIVIDSEIVRGLDGDKDSLSDVEEVLYKSDPKIFDTDQDGYGDGLEVAQAYSPLTGPNTKMLDDKLVKEYTNVTGKYSLLYPASFKISGGVSSTSDAAVSFISPDGAELFTVSVQNNPQKITAAEWYLAQNPNLAIKDLRQLEVNGIEAVWSVTGKELYLSAQQKIYTIAYNFTTKSSADFVATFEMLIHSFKVTK